MDNRVEVEVLYETETDLAYAVRTEEDGKIIWLPKSKVEEVNLDGDIMTISGPERLFQEKGLI
jgi:hypothetical protein